VYSHISKYPVFQRGEVIKAVLSNIKIFYNLVALMNGYLLAMFDINILTCRILFHASHDFSKIVQKLCLNVFRVRGGGLLNGRIELLRKALFRVDGTACMQRAISLAWKLRVV